MTDRTTQTEMPNTEAVGSEDQASHAHATTTTTITARDDADNNKSDNTTTTLLETNIHQVPIKDQAAEKGQLESPTEKTASGSPKGSAIHVEFRPMDGALSAGIKQLGIDIRKEDDSTMTVGKIRLSDVSNDAQKINQRTVTIQDADAPASLVDTEQAPSETNTTKNQSVVDREANFQAAVDKVGPKIDNDPSSITKEDAALLHSREARAHGVTQKGGITAEAQRLAAENEKMEQS